MVKAVKADATPLRLGVVGVGVMGYNHARVLAEMPGVTLTGVADPDEKQADFVRHTLGCVARTNAAAALGSPCRAASASMVTSSCPASKLPLPAWN